MGVKAAKEEVSLIHCPLQVQFVAVAVMLFTFVPLSFAVGIVKQRARTQIVLCSFELLVGTKTQQEVFANVGIAKVFLVPVFPSFVEWVVPVFAHHFIKHLPHCVHFEKMVATGKTKGEALTKQREIYCGLQNCRILSVFLSARGNTAKYLSQGPFSRIERHGLKFEEGVGNDGQQHDAGCAGEAL
jgi:hypothetical protein